MRYKRRKNKRQILTRRYGRFAVDEFFLTRKNKCAIIKLKITKFSVTVKIFLGGESV